MYKNTIKVILDFGFASLAFIVLFPLFFLITLFLFLTNKGKPFFVQKRPGKNEKIFNIIKFKTMNDKKDQMGNLLPDEKRLTSLGIFIRSTSLDEIPQLLNVIKGDMSIVGPRPLLPEYLPLYSKVQKQRHDVRPGITGYAQVNGRNAIDWEKKFELDVYYVQNMSFLVDTNILLRTVRNVFMRADINNENAATIEPFKGTN